MIGEDVAGNILAGDVIVIEDVNPANIKQKDILLGHGVTVDGGEGPYMLVKVWQLLGMV